ncbi:MAG: hypothetical protein IKV50_06765 [Clostridia bacterium]|nr:hypothetical protein [Clostridia bacterium]MBR6553311.1 hypothetical protein [Clostridia bacterium]
MDENFSEKLKAVLADPEALAKISAIASSMGGREEPKSLPASVPPSVPKQKDPRLDLLFALRPLVAEHKQKRIDDLMQIATVASLLGSFGNRGGKGLV